MDLFWKTRFSLYADILTLIRCAITIWSNLRVWMNNFGAMFMPALKFNAFSLPCFLECSDFSSSKFSTFQFSNLLKKIKFIPRASRYIVFFPVLEPPSTPGMYFETIFLNKRIELGNIWGTFGCFMTKETHRWNVLQEKIPDFVAFLRTCQS